MKFKQILPVLLFIFLLSGCSDDEGNETAVYDANGIWTLTFTQTNTVDGDYIECGRDPIPQRSFEIIQNGNDVSLLDKNGEVVKGSVNGEKYVFEFKEQEDLFDEDYIEFRLKLKLSSETACTGPYRMDERTFFTDYNESFFCITEGTFVGTCPYDPKKDIERGTVKDIDGNVYQTVKIGTHGGWQRTLR